MTMLRKQHTGICLNNADSAEMTNGTTILQKGYLKTRVTNVIGVLAYERIMNCRPDGQKS